MSTTDKEFEARQQVIGVLLVILVAAITGGIAYEYGGPRMAAAVFMATFATLSLFAYTILYTERDQGIRRGRR